MHFNLIDVGIIAKSNFYVKYKDGAHMDAREPT